MIIAIDGPAASGKSTVAKELALKLNFLHFCTGTMYRAITAYCIKNKLIEKLPESISSIISDIDISFKNNNFKDLLINHSDFSNYYYTSETNKFVSQISSINAVRKKMVLIQRSFSLNKNIVCEGRDIGTVVFPNAELKFFLEASIKCRAERRFKEEVKKNNNVTLSQLEILIKKRDELDMSREHSPLKKSDDSILIDTTKLDVDAVVRLMYKKIKGSF